MRWIAVVLCLGLLAGCAGTRPFDEDVPEDEWTREPGAVPLAKIGRGVWNGLSCPVDIPATVQRLWEDSVEPAEYAYSCTVGVGEGLCNAVVRFGAGVVEILSFPMLYDADPLYNRPYGDSVFTWYEEDF